MRIFCKHCGTRYPDFTGHGDFCCGGCEQVYRLIRDEGLEGFYSLRDRVGEPPVLDAADAGSSKWVAAAQTSAEAEPPVEVKLSIQGMSCMGCAWLVERLARGQLGVTSARVQLESNTVLIAWVPGAFSLLGLVHEWQRFGYTAKSYEATARAQLSPLAWRTVLCGLFAANGLFLGALPAIGFEVGTFENLFHLLSLLIVLLSAIVGASFFVMPAYQSLRVKRVHYDTLTALGLMLGLLATVLGLGEMPQWVFSVLVFTLLGARWWHRDLWRRYAPPAGDLEPAVFSVLQVYVLPVLALSVAALVCTGLKPAVAVLLASSLYPLARGATHQMPRWCVVLFLMLGVLGALIGWVTASLALTIGWMVLTGTLSSVLFFRLSAANRSVSH
ncbi:MAG: heavy metal translocating P-type ATPase metal-binding domain-containing protein [Opitutales bacterium]|nr:heavy metal translocating P-type ATPase metal-binding domain-containing protein [Opitutales bacterium]